MKPIKILVIDDSVAMQEFIKKMVAVDDDLQIVGQATDPYEARELIKSTHPDVLILDIEMPRMDGLTFLENLMRLRPLPVVMNSSLSQRGSYETIKALELGACDYIGKPRSAEEMSVYQQRLIEKVKRAAKANMNRVFERHQNSPQKINPADTNFNRSTFDYIIGLGASTGGVEALSSVLRTIPAVFPPITIVQHIPPKFSTSFAERLNEICNIAVYEASNGQVLESGCAYLAPGGMHMTVEKKGAQYCIRTYEAEPVSGHMPSVDVLFSSLAKISDKKIAAALLTGMGNDGAAGLKAIFDNNGSTIVQDKASATVWGMPGSALEMEPKHKVLPLKDVAEDLVLIVEGAR